MIKMRFWTTKDLNSIRNFFEREGWCEFKELGKGGFEISNCEHWANLTEKEIRDEFEGLKKFTDSYKAELVISKHQDRKPVKVRGYIRRKVANILEDEDPKYKVIHITEQEARELFRKYHPQIWGANPGGYELWPLTPNVCLYLKTTKKGRFVDAMLVYSHNKWKDWVKVVE